MKICTVIGARPQFIKASLISNEISSHTELSEIIVHTGQHYDRNMSSVFFQDMKIPKPKYNLNINQLSYGDMINKIFQAILPILSKENIEGVIVYGDTNSTLAGCLAAKKMNIPVFHIEAGLRSGNRLMHEENNRLITDHLSELLFCPSQNAVNNLKREKIDKGVFLTGDVMYDSFVNFKSIANKKSNQLTNLKYIISTIHRRENINSVKRLSSIFKNLDIINEEIDVIMPIHPHTLKKIDQFKINTSIKLIEPSNYSTMLSYLINSKMVITDSGGLQKEAFFAQKKCITVRAQTEWNELVKEKVNLLCEPDYLYKAYSLFSKRNCDFSKKLFGSGNASNLIVNKIIKFFK